MTNIGFLITKLTRVCCLKANKNIITDYFKNKNIIMLFSLSYFMVHYSLIIFFYFMWHIDSLFLYRLIKTDCLAIYFYIHCNNYFIKLSCESSSTKFFKIFSSAEISIICNGVKNMAFKGNIPLFLLYTSMLYKNWSRL